MVRKTINFYREHVWNFILLISITSVVVNFIKGIQSMNTNEQALDNSFLNISSTTIIYAFLDAVSIIISLVLYGFIYDRKHKLRTFNKLYKCTNTQNNICGKYIRKYQLDLYEAKHGVSKCPHCQTTNEDILEPLPEYDPFIDHSLEAPKINILSMKDIVKSIRLLSKIRIENEAEQRFLEFQESRKVSKTKEIDWIRHIQPLQKKIAKVEKVKYDLGKEK